MNRSKLFLLVFLIAAGLFVIMVVIPQRRTQQRIADSAHKTVQGIFPLMVSGEADSLEKQLASCATENQFDPIIVSRIPGYLVSVTARKLQGEDLSPNGYPGFLSLLTEHPAALPPDDLRALLHRRFDPWTVNACLIAMGKSGNKDFISDVKKLLPKAWAIDSYALLAGKASLPILLACLDPNLSIDGRPIEDPRIRVNFAIQALGHLRDPSLLPLLNDIGEYKHGFRQQIEIAISEIAQIDETKCVPVAANMFSLPVDFPSVEPNQGRWHGNGHISMRNLLENAAKKRGLPNPETMDQNQWRDWWEQNRGQFTSIEEIRTSYDRQHFLDLLALGRHELELK